MLNTLIKHTRFSDILELASPELFKVMPVAGLKKAASKLVSNRTSASKFDAARQARATSIAETIGGIAIVDDLDVFDETKPADGHKLLELYFLQLWDDAPAILDLRRARFGTTSSGIAWNPKPYFIEFEPGFKASMKRIYRGFYDADDVLFRKGLAEVGLDGVEDLFRRHFGDGDQTDVTFELDHFRTTFMQIFEHCREQDVALHHDFISLGISLATLYEHLDALGGSYDVRAAFRAASGT